LSASRSAIPKCLSTFGRPRGFPLLPGLKRVRFGGRPYPTSALEFVDFDSSRGPTFFISYILPSRRAKAASPVYGRKVYHLATPGFSLCSNLSLKKTDRRRMLLRIPMIRRDGKFILQTCGRWGHRSLTKAFAVSNEDRTSETPVLQG
jgi:hypothetical protein